MIRHILQQPWIHSNCIIAHFLCLKVVRDMLQLVRFFAHCHFTHSFGFKTIRDSVHLPWMFFNCLNIHLPRPIFIRNIVHQTWASLNCLNTRLSDDGRIQFLNKSISFLYTLRGRVRVNFLYRVTRYKRVHVYAHNFSVSFFFIFRNTPIPPSWGMPGSRH